MIEVDESQPYIIKVPGVLSEVECNLLIERIESMGPTTATVNTLSGTQVKPRIRNNDRVIFDDDSLAALLMERLSSDAPKTCHGMKLVGANERFRCYRYQKGMRFAPHSDGAFYRNDFEFSCYTCLFYLNSSFKGGATTFVTEPEIVIRPVTGMALLFQHPIIHEGSVVESGVKYVCRTDLMYRSQEKTADK
ncbi:MAG: 2OG-Fe(II) oxygenase [Planctomycetaceae bacterium]|nr:2OG-Fe(II) oxygenase [Planctomycetaceae bacterium]